MADIVYGMCGLDIDHRQEDSNGYYILCSIFLVTLLFYGQSKRKYTAKRDITKLITSILIFEIFINKLSHLMTHFWCNLL